MELTLPKGALSEQRAEITTFYGDLFGWEAIDVPILKQTGLLLRTDPETSQFELPWNIQRQLGGADLLMCCSDYPNSEGTAEPLSDYAAGGRHAALAHTKDGRASRFEMRNTYASSRERIAIAFFRLLEHDIRLDAIDRYYAPTHPDL